MCASVRACFLVLFAFLCLTAIGRAAPIVWDGGNANWDGVATRWNPDDEPDSDDEAIFNTNNTVNLANASESIMALTMSGSIELLLNGNDLTVNGGNVTLSGAGTLLDVPTNSALNTDDVFVNADASLTMHGGTITMAQSGGEAVLTVASGGELGGFGTINSTDVIAAANTTVLSLGGNLAVFTFDLFSQQAGTLTINVPANGRVDLDQTGAVIDITRNDTLDINGAAHDPAVDAYGGTLNLAEGATIDMSNAWGMNAGSINVNTNGINVNTAGAAATIAGADFAMTGGAINLADNLDSLRFTTNFTARGGTINNNGLMIFDADADIQVADFQMNGASASITLADDISLFVAQGDFDLGGAGDDTGNVTTIGNQSELSVYMDFDSGAGDLLDHRIELNGGNLFVHNVDSGFVGADTTWHLSGGVVNANVGTNFLTGDDLLIQAETINIAAGSVLNINTSSVEITSPTINIDGALNFGVSSHWMNSTVSVTGGGTMFPGIVTIGSAGSPVDVVWNVANVDWDDNGSTTIVGGSSLTINADTIEPDLDGYGSEITIGDEGTLAVNLNFGGRWTLASGGTITHNGDADPTSYEYLAGSDIAVNGTINHNGRAAISARLDIGASGIINILTNNEPLVMGGGNNSDDPNTISGGTINGPGYLDVGAARALIGFGTINAGVNVFGTLKADNGILNINGPIFGDGILGTNDADGILNVTQPWNTNQADTVYLNGGELRGAPINVSPNGIRGHGLVSAQVFNDGWIVAEGGGLLILQTPGNDNDWDGAAGDGRFGAYSANLEIRDSASFPFSGQIDVGFGQMMFANGFELEFEPGSTIQLLNGTYRSTHATDFGGAVSVIAGGPSTLQIGGTAVFENGSSTTLDDDLLLDNPTTVVQVGADFTGGGLLKNLPSNTLQLLNGVMSADLAVTVENQGVLRLGTAGAAGTASAASYRQGATGVFDVDLGGTGSGESDRLTIDGQVLLDGTLELSLLAPYVPSVGNTIPILSATGGLGGTTFANVIQPPDMPVALEFDVVYTPTLVQLIVDKIFSADFDLDGDVDGDDLTVWQGAYGAGAGADADGDGDSDGRDYLIWQRQYGSGVSPLIAQSEFRNLHSLSVPEPPALSLAVLAGTALALRRRCAGQIQPPSTKLRNGCTSQAVPARHRQGVPNDRSRA